MNSITKHFTTRNFTIYLLPDLPKHQEYRIVKQYLAFSLTFNFGANGLDSANLNVERFRFSYERIRKATKHSIYDKVLEKNTFNIDNYNVVNCIGFPETFTLPKTKKGAVKKTLAIFTSPVIQTTTVNQLKINPVTIWVDLEKNYVSFNLK